MVDSQVEILQAIDYGLRTIGTYYFLPSIQPITPPVMAIIIPDTNGSINEMVRLEIFMVPYMPRLKAKPRMSPMIRPAEKPPPNVVMLAHLPKTYTRKYA